jgi:hypothetical protein
MFKGRTVESLMDRIDTWKEDGLLDRHRGIDRDKRRKIDRLRWTEKDR